MIRLLFGLIFAEVGMIVMFVFKTPLRKLIIMCLDRVKRGRGPTIVKTVAGTIFVVMMASVYNAVEIQRRWSQDAEVNPTDQVLMANHILEASLMGFSLFLAFMIDKLHHYIRELRMRRKSMENPPKKQGGDGSENVKALEEESATLRVKIKQLEAELKTKTKESSDATYKLAGKIKQLEAELEEKTKESSNAEANKLALKKQSEGFLLEYDRLLEENQSLKSQLQSLDRKLSHSDSKKTT